MWEIKYAKPHIKIDFKALENEIKEIIENIRQAAEDQTVGGENAFNKQ